MKKLVISALLASLLGLAMRHPATAQRVGESYRVASPDVLLIVDQSEKPRHGEIVQAGEGVIVKLTEADANKSFTFVSRRDGQRIEATSLELACDVDDDGRFVGETYCESFLAAGLTLDECAAQIEERLDDSLRIESPRVTVRKLRKVPDKLLACVAADGTFTWGALGKLDVAGKTVDEIERLVESRLAEFYERPKASVEVVGHASSQCHVIIQWGGGGDYLYDLVLYPRERPFRVSDAVRGVSFPQPINPDAVKMYIARPTPVGSKQEPTPSDKRDEVLDVDWNAVAGGRDTSTDHLMRPGDRLFIKMSGSASTASPTPRSLSSPAPYTKLPANESKTDTTAGAQGLDLRCDVTVVCDRSDVLGDIAPFDEVLSVCETERATTAVRNVRGRRGVDVSMVTVETRLARSASAKLDSEAAVEGKQEDDGVEVEINPELTQLPFSEPDSDPSVMINVTARVSDRGRTSEVATGCVYEPGRSAVLRVPSALGEPGTDELGSVYVVLTPKLVERR